MLRLCLKQFGDTKVSLTEHYNFHFQKYFPYCQIPLLFASSRWTKANKFRSLIIFPQLASELFDSKADIILIFPIYMF